MTYVKFDLEQIETLSAGEDPVGVCLTPAEVQFIAAAVTAAMARFLWEYDTDPLTDSQWHDALALVDALTAKIVAAGACP